MVTQKSRVLEIMRGGGVATCTKINLMDARVAEIAAIAGFDCVWADMEHVPNDLSAIEKIVLATKAYGVDCLVRVSRGGYSDYIRPLEADAAGIMVPHVMSEKDAREVVRITKFSPLGRRPVDGGNADGGYELMPFEDYLRYANENRFLCMQIEDPEALSELDDIAALPGVDMLFFGPGDFSCAIGHPLEFSHPEVVRVRGLVAQVARSHGKFAGTVCAWPVDDVLAEGFNFISMGADIVCLGEGYTRMTGTLREAILRAGLRGED